MSAQFSGHKIPTLILRAAHCPSPSLTMTSLKAEGGKARAKQVILDVGGERFIAARETLTVFPATRS